MWAPHRFLEIHSKAYPQGEGKKIGMREEGRGERGGEGKGKKEGEGRRDLNSHAEACGSLS